MQLNNLEGNYTNIQSYNVGIYLRLSREDESTHESASISNQRDFLTKYAFDNCWKIHDVYIDDGWSGTSFDRPAFKKMLQDIEAKKINMVIVKDLSRLGRNTARVIDFIEEYFPIHNIRFIAVNDGIDTFEDSSSNAMSPFLAVMHDMYCKDISKKVRTAFNTKRNKGEYIGSYAPFGYMKDPDDKNKLIIDEEAAPIVRRIFELLLNGHSYKQITHLLNDEGVIPPAVYRSQNSSFDRNFSRSKLWSTTMIRNIIKNPTYSGNITQNKVRKINYKTDKLINIPKDKWISIENTHEGIIDIETFEIAQRIANTKVNYTKDKEIQSRHLLQGIIFCGDCGARMTFEHAAKSKYYVVCSTYIHKSKKACTRHSIHEDTFNEHVLEELKKLAQPSVDKNKVLAALKGIKPLSKNTIEKEILTLQNRLDDISRALKTLYEDKIKGVISQYDFIELSNGYIKERENILPRLAAINEKKLQQQEASSTDIHLKLLENFLEMNDIIKQDLVQLIDKIEVFEVDKKQKRVEITYKFKNPLE